MAIELPGYRNLIGSEMFEKVKSPGSSSKNKTEVASLIRYKTPTPDETLNFIKVSAQEFYSESSGLRIQRNPVQQYFRLLERSDLAELGEGRGGLFGHLNHHIDKLDIGNYITFWCSLIPDSKLDEIKRRIKNTKIDHTGVHQFAEKKLGVLVRLTDEGLFPDISELEFLLARGVKISDPLKITCDSGNYQGAANRLRLIYNKLNSPETISQIKDETQSFLEKNARDAIKATVGCALKHAVYEVFGSARGNTDKTPFSEN
ncbi:MAG: hypothetical protein AABW63_01955 [Nanoarchaeota archaeon]